MYKSKIITSIVFLLLFPLFFSLLLTNILFICKIPIQSFYLPLSYFIGIIIYKIVESPNNKDLLKGIIFSLTIFCICIFVSGYFYDTSSDGQSYHQEAIILLKNGWNPLYEIPTGRTGNLWIEHYSKGAETIQALIYKLTNRIEMGKSINLLFLIISFLLGLLCLKKLQISKYQVYILSFLLSACPVCISQLFTYYIDGILYSCILSLIYTIVLIITEGKKSYYFLLSGIILVGSSIKFTSLAIIAIILLLILFSLFILKRINVFKNILIISSITGLLIFPIVCANPYITNIVKGKHLLYPLKGEGAVDIITPFVPKKFNQKNRFEKFTISMFSKTGQIQDGGNILKIPFSISIKEIYRLADPDIGVAGFGVIYSGIFILTLILFISIFIKNGFYLNLLQKYILYLIIILLISVFIIPEPWWFRYTPHFYIIPFLMLVFIIFQKNGSRYNKIINAIYILYTVNILLFIGVILLSNIHATERINYQLDKLRVYNKPIKVEYNKFPSNTIRLEEHNIPFQLGHFYENEPFEGLETSKNTKITIVENSVIKKNFILKLLDKYLTK